MGSPWSQRKCALDQSYVELGQENVVLWRSLKGGWSVLSPVISGDNLKNQVDIGKKFKEGARFPKHQDFLLSMEFLMIPLKAGRF